MLKTFKAKIHGTVSIRQGEQSPIDQTITFTKYKIKLKDEQINRIYFDPLLVQVVADKMEYSFDKKLNKDDKKMFSIILKQKLNALDNCLYHLDISLWNKIKANIIHNRYWLDREKEWFFKTLVAATIGFLFAVIGGKIGYQQGYENGLKEGKAQKQDTIRKQ
ncbi:hypothetical protein ACFOWM_13185 [Ferruginibacter yonginensis]|uniref:Uncharacterized protein n=1 Tax=Ferruginibacter yonginensis TaxID=1310416 RepID=A0ABV8QUN8_9BACT